MKKNGSALIVVVFAMMLLAVLGWSLVAMMSSDFEANIRRMDSERALYLAESGTQHAYANLIVNPSWRDANPTTYYSLKKGTSKLGEYIMKVEDGTGADAGYIVATVTGYVPDHLNYRATRIIKKRMASFPWTEAIDAVHLLDWSAIWLQRFFTYVKGDLRAANWDGDNNHTYNETGFLNGDYNTPPAAMPLPTSGYDRLCGTVNLPDLDLEYYKTVASTAGHYVNAPYIFIADYATSGTNDLRILDNIPSGPTSPTGGSGGTCGVTGNNSRDIDGYFYTSSNYYTCLITQTRFQVVNVTSKTSPTTSGCDYETITDGRGVCVRVTGSSSTPNRNTATRAYVADGSSHYLRIINISNPGSTSIVRSYSLDSSATIWDVVVRGNSSGAVYAYVAAGTAGFKIVTVTNDPASPTIRTCSWSGDDVRGVCVRGSYAFVTDYSGTYSYLRIIDISDPSSPSVLASVALDNYTVASGTKMSVAVKGNYAYVAAGPNGVKVVDISNLANYGHLPQAGEPGYPDATGTVIATYRPDNNEAIDIKVSGDVQSSTTADKKSYAYVVYSSSAGSPRLQVLDITMPANIAEVAGGTYALSSGKAVFLYGDKYFQSGNYNNEKVWYTVGNTYIEGGNMNHTSLVAEGDFEIIGTSSLNMKAHVDKSARENFPNLATQRGSIIGSGGLASLQFDGLVYSKFGNIDFNYFIDVINAVCLMGYNIYFDALTVVDYQDKYIGDPPAGFTSSATQKDWREL